MKSSKVPRDRKAYRKEWYRKNKDIHNKNCSEYNKQHREQCREAQRKFHKLNPNKQTEYIKKYKMKKCLELGVSESELNRMNVQRRASKKGMTVSEYYKDAFERRMNKYATKFRIPVKEFKRLYNTAHYYKCKMWEVLNMSEEEYRLILKEG